MGHSSVSSQSEVWRQSFQAGVSPGGSRNRRNKDGFCPGILRFSCLSIFFFNVFFKYINLFILFIYFWLRWVFVAARGLSLVAVSGGYSLLWCVGFSLWWLLLLQRMG